MKKTVFLPVLLLLLALCSGCIGKPVAVNEDYEIGLIIMEPEVWKKQTMETGIRRAAEELGLMLYDLTPEAEGENQATDQIRQAIADRCRILAVHAPRSPELLEALQEAAEAGIRVVALDSDMEVTSVTAIAPDYQAAGRKAGEAMLAALQAKRIPAGPIGVLLADAQDWAARQKEEGFRAVFAGTDYTLLDTRYHRGNETMARSIAWDWLNQGTVGIFGGDTAAVQGAGDGAKVADSRAVIVGCGLSEEIQVLLEEGFVRSLALTDYETLCYDSILNAAAPASGEAAKSQQTQTNVILLESDTPVRSSRDYKIALIARDPRDLQWNQVKAGAEKAAEELDCGLVDLSPAFQNKKQQVRQIEQAVSKGFHAIITATGNSETVSGALQAAMDAGVKVICVDDSPYLEPDVTFELDYGAAGRAAAEQMLEQLAAWEVETGAIGIIGLQEEAESALLLEAGFRSVFEDTGYTLLDTQYSEGDAARGHLLAESYFWKKAKAVFCCDEASLLGAGNAVEARGWDMIVMGFGISDRIDDLLDAGAIRAAITADGLQLGYDAVETACQILSTDQSPDTIPYSDFQILTAE